MFFINFSFLFIAFQPFHTVSLITFNMKHLFQQIIFEMYKAIAVLQLILKGCLKPSPQDRTLVGILWLK